MTERRCIHTRQDGKRCPLNEAVDGLEYCIRHMPDDLLDEAEEISGTRRCRQDFGTPDACHALAAEGTDPPRCEPHTRYGTSAQHPEHGRPPGGARKDIEQRLADHLQVIMSGRGAALINPPRIGDPLLELLDVAAEVKALKEIMREKTAELLSLDKVRYGSKVGEQINAYILLYERALERYEKLLIDIGKLRIEDRLAGVQEATAMMLERALDAALQESGVGLDGIVPARKAFRRHLKVVQAELVG